MIRKPLVAYVHCPHCDKFLSIHISEKEITTVVKEEDE